MMNIETVIQNACLLGEGPVWDFRKKTICWVDILNGQIHEYSPSNQTHKINSVHQMIGAVAICRSGHFIAALKNGFGFIDRDLGIVSMISNPEPDIPGNRFNDGKCGPDGRFWAGTMSHTDEPEKGSFYLLDRDLSVTKKMERVSISNGLTWSLDNSILYYIDTPTFTVAAFDFDRVNAEITNKRIAIRIPKNNGSPDGMTIDSEGMLWIAHWDGWQITRWDPISGKKLLSIPLPVARVTSCCFGGELFGDLYITSAKNGLSQDQLRDQPLAGSLFVIENIGYNGLPLFEFDA
ncbi:MAG TPA: SMP-30/gluconolactonase/LRE family protein [Puia sp.]